ncbi:hypothetical protein ACA910_004114 [Epithemia clementina (nom. ined.)]
MKLVARQWIALLFVLEQQQCACGAAFVANHLSHRTGGRDVLAATPTELEVEPIAVVLKKERDNQKRLLLGILNPEPKTDAVLADPRTKEPLVIKPQVGTFFGSSRSRPGTSTAILRRRISYEMQAKGSDYAYTGSSDSYLNLLEPQDVIQSNNNNRPNDSNDSNSGRSPSDSARQRRLQLIRNLSPLIPPPIRSALATAGVLVADDYVPMRDLFTSPSVSFAYERGWRSSFRRAGFPGEDEEAQMAMNYFAPSMARYHDTRVLVDMSCATGLFTRRFAQSGLYKRVLGCDYSASMLDEARRRIEADPKLRYSINRNNTTRLDLVRLDVGQIPMQNNSVDALHAGAAMHCWPDLPAAAAEIYRVLKPGGRYFATTFLSDYFRILNAGEGGSTGPSRQAFQYFESVNQLKQLMEQGGFAPDKINIEVLAPSCVVIRCEK